MAYDGNLPRLRCVDDHCNKAMTIICHRSLVQYHYDKLGAFYYVTASSPQHPMQIITGKNDLKWLSEVHNGKTKQ